MSQSTVHTFRAVTAPGGGDHAGEVSPLSSPYDDLNQRIIRLLQDDGRAAYDEIAQKLGVSGGTIRNRVARMHEAGMLRIVAVVDPGRRRCLDSRMQHWFCLPVLFSPARLRAGHNQRDASIEG